MKNSAATSTQPTTLLKRSNQFKATYLRVLNARDPLPEDWWAAKELIDAGYATGKVQLSHGRENYHEVITLLLFAPTMSGRMLADELTEAIRRQTWRYRFTKGAIAVGGFVSGWLLGVLTEVGKAFATRWLGF